MNKKPWEFPKARFLLPEPGPEVVGICLDRITELEARVSDLMEGLRRADERENKIKNEAADLEDECDDLQIRLAAVKEWRNWNLNIGPLSMIELQEVAIAEYDKLEVILTGDFACPGCEDKRKQLVKVRDIMTCDRSAGSTQKILEELYDLLFEGDGTTETLQSETDDN